MNIERDGHVHSPYCPHGSNDSFEKYITEAITKGIKEITFTEHLMFPKEIVDEEFYKTCAPDEKALECYFKEIDNIKVNYKDKIKVNTGLEVDYIEGYEEELRESLNKYGRRLDDGILSVHFLKVEDKFYAVDGLESFEDLLKSVGTLSKVYDLYFDTLIKAIKSDLGEFKPRRIGHPTLVRIFNKKYPYNYENNKKIDEFLQAIKEANYEIDVNTAGLRKPYCGEVYPSGYFFNKAKELGIDMVFGSDSHKAEDIAANFNKDL